MQKTRSRSRQPCLVLVLFVGSGCVRAGYDAPGSPVADLTRLDGSRDGHPDGPPRPDGVRTDRRSQDVIPAGTFYMGSPAAEPCRYPSEVLHQVTLTHHIEAQATEVTQGQFTALMSYNPSHFGPSGGGTNCGADCPVETVNWYEAVAYCNALSQQAGKTPCYTCTGTGKSIVCQEAAAYSGQQVYACPGFRLPTEAEWEHAYRAGTTTAYYSGEVNGAGCSGCTRDSNADPIAWYCSNSGDVPHPVGTKQPNAWGLHDMAGNVWEWCHDWHQSDLGTSPVTDPWGAPTGTHRLVRGGSWKYGGTLMRAALRNKDMPDYRDYNLGFRCTRTLSL